MSYWETTSYIKECLDGSRGSGAKVYMYVMGIIYSVVCILLGTVLLGKVYWWLIVLGLLGVVGIVISIICNYFNNRPRW